MEGKTDGHTAAATMEGFAKDKLSQLTADQMTALTKFRALVSDFPGQPDTSDLYYLLWLRAREYSVEKAVNMYRDHLKFRQEIGADTILDWTPPKVLRKCLPGGYFGEDRDGHPVWYESLGNLDIRGLARAVKPEDVLRYKVQQSETITQLFKEYSLRKGKFIDTITAIVDCENLSLQRHYYWPGIHVIRQIFTMFEANYPERTKRILIVKAPKVFPFTYSLVRLFLSENTKEKIVVLGRNWQTDLQKYIAPDQIPQAYGGTRCEPDPWCTDHINPGCDIPPEYYLTNQTETSRVNMNRAVVSRGGHFDVERSVDLPGSSIWWEFVSTEHDIAFGCFFQSWRNNKKHKVAVVPMKRRNSHLIPEDGVLTCDRTGIYVLKFDNSYSWTKSKEVFYSVKVLPPKDLQVNLPDVRSQSSDIADSDTTLYYSGQSIAEVNDGVLLDESDSSSEEFFDCCDYFPWVEEPPNAQRLLNCIHTTV